VSALVNSGAVSNSLGKYDDALSFYQAALKLNPQHGDAWTNLCNLHLTQGRFKDAVQAGIRATQYAPRNPNAHANLSLSQFLTNDYEAAGQSARVALAIDPEHANAWNNLGQVLQRQSRLAEAVDAYREALKHDPHLKFAHSNWLFCMHFDGRWSPQQIFENHVQWAQRYEAPLLAKPSKFRQGGPMRRRPRVAFISPDLFAHPVGYFLRPLIEHWPHERLELGFYASVKRPDASTEWFKSKAEFWCDILPMADEQAADRIAQDGVDVLIDLSGHTGQSRLRVLAYRPAPVQVSWLGYFDTTGMSSVQYVIADATCVTPEMERYFTEKVVRLPDDFACFDPMIDAPQPTELPALKNGYITFGSQNQLAKINDEVLQLWAQVLGRVTGSRLKFQAQAFNDPEVVERYARKFEELGVDLGRIDFLPGMSRQQVLNNYGQMDIALDPFPCAGGTTTCEALWMGVPVVTLIGDRFGGRHSASHLRAAGLSQMVANNQADYLGIVGRLSQDWPALAKLRAGLREQVRVSPLCDGSRFAHHFGELVGNLLQGFATTLQVQPLAVRR
jgi:predicted O-linked N-acetylglucosamine transferase (SPINDLY family)